MKKIIPFIAIAAAFSIAIAQDYTKVIHRTDGRSFAIHTSDVDSVSYLSSSQVPSEQYNWVDTIYKEIHDTLVNNYFIHDTIIQENVVFVHDTIYIDTEPKNTYTINGVEYPMPEFIDLGLPSGTLWASMDIGSYDCCDEGLKFAWGEVSPKDTYTIDNYKFGYCPFNGSGNPTKYNLDDGKMILDPEDDAATFNLGGSCRIPSITEVKEIIRECIFSDENNMIKVVGPNGNCIYFPIYNHHYTNTRSMEDVNSVVSTFVVNKRGEDGGYLSTNNTGRYAGQYIRSVK